MCCLRKSFKRARRGKTYYGTVRRFETGKSALSPPFRYFSRSTKPPRASFICTSTLSNHEDSEHFFLFQKEREGTRTYFDSVGVLDFFLIPQMLWYPYPFSLLNAAHKNEHFQVLGYLIALSFPHRFLWESLSDRLKYLYMNNGKVEECSMKRLECCVWYIKQH